MKLRDFLLLVLICLVWGYSNVLSKIVVGNWGVPPLFFAAVRFAVVIAATIPWLLPMPRPRWRILVIGLLMGAGNFALLFIGLQTASPSAAAVVIQIGVPFTTLLSIVMLGSGSIGVGGSASRSPWQACSWWYGIRRAWHFRPGCGSWWALLSRVR